MAELKGKTMAKKPLSFETTVYNALEKTGKKVGNVYINSRGDYNRAASYIVPALIGSLGIGLTYYITQKLKENEQLRKRKFLGLF